MVFLFLSGVTPAYSAQDGRSLSDNTPIYEKPDTRSTSLYWLARGETIRMSSRQKRGWYRVLLPRAVGSLRFGWVRSDTVAPDTMKRDLMAAGISLADPVPRVTIGNNWLLSLHVNGHFAQPSAVQSRFADSGGFLMPGYGLAFGFRPVSSVSLQALLQLDRFSRTPSAALSYNYSGTTLALLAEWSFFYNGMLRFGVAGGGGVSVGSAIEATSTQTVGSRTTTTTADTGTFLMPEGIAKLTGRWYVWERFAVGLDAGYRYMAKSAVTFSGKPFDVNLSAPFVGAAIQLEF